MLSTYELIIFVIWVALSVLIALSLYYKTGYFKKLSSVILLFFIFIASVILHNLISALITYFWVEVDEPVFFILALLSFGVFVILGVIQIFVGIKRLIEKMKKLK